MKIKPRHVVAALGLAGAAALITFAPHHHSGPADVYPPSSVKGTINTSITQANINQTICNPHWSTKSERPTSAYTTALKEKQMQQLVLTGGTASFEEDHLISLELGGNPTDPNNLWPEPYSASIPDGGAKSKDTVENELHREVCAGTITLAKAQEEISTDWYAVKTSGTTFGSLTIDNTDPDDETN